MKQFWILIFFAVVVAGCNNNGDNAVTATDQAGNSEFYQKPEQEQKQEEEKEGGEGEPVIDERKLIRTGNIEYEVDDIDTVRKRIANAVSSLNGYISSERAYQHTGRKGITIVSRVPGERFNALLEMVSAGVEDFDTREISINDVTEEFLDVQARLRTKKELEGRYLELLKRATTVKDILEIERQAGELRTEIESIEGRLRYLQNQVGYSTLTITIYESRPNEMKFGNKTMQGLRSGWNNLLYFIIGLVHLWPFLVLALVLYVFFRVRRSKKRKDVRS